MNSQSGGWISAVNPDANTRGQSETIGIVLILGIMLLGALAVVGLGATAISDTKDQLSEQRAEKALTQFDSKAGLVALGESDSQRVKFPTDTSEQFNVVQTGAWMNISFTNQSSDYTEEIVNVTLGSVVYERDDTKIAYQGGGVFRENDQGGTMVAPPEFHFRNGTLTLPTVNITGDETLGNAATITQNGVERHFPRSGSVNKTNPLDNHLVTVTVGSEYYEGWGEYFEERTDGKVEYFHNNETVELTLVSPIELTTVTSASSSLATNGDFTVNGNSATRCSSSPAGDRYTDSYNSSETTRDYCEQIQNGETGWNGDIIYGGDIDIGSGAGGSDFCGEIKGGGDVTTSSTGNNDGTECGEGQGGQPTIYGNISHAGSCSNCGDALAGYSGAPFEVNDISDIQTISQVDWYVNNSLDRIEENADQTNPTLNDGTELDAGTYFFDSLTVSSSDQVEFNTSDGNIEIGVDQDVDIQDSAVINVTGDGVVKVYVGGEGTGTGDHLTMAGNAMITNDGDNATKFRMYGNRDFNATLGDGGSGNLAKYVGVLYAPPGVDGSGVIELDGAEIYGGLVTGTTRIPSGGTGSIHYDEALQGEQIISPGASVIKVTYLHVTINKIKVEGS
jgi:hypothetical protein